MTNYNRDDRNDRGRSGGGFNRGGDRGGRFGNKGGFNRSSSFERKEMFDTVCDECGKDCQVPFKPSGEKPVYCSDCYKRLGDGQSNDRDDRRSDDRRPSERRFERSSERTFGAKAPETSLNSNVQISKLMDQMVSLNSKMEKIVRMMEAQVVQEPAAKKEYSGKKDKSVAAVVEAPVDEKPAKKAKKPAAKKKKVE